MQPTFLRGAESEGATAAVHLSVGLFLFLATASSGFGATPLPACAHYSFKSCHQQMLVIRRINAKEMWWTGGALLPLEAYHAATGNAQSLSAPKCHLRSPHPVGTGACLLSSLPSTTSLSTFKDPEGSARSLGPNAVCLALE